MLFCLKIAKIQLEWIWTVEHIKFDEREFTATFEFYLMAVAFTWTQIVIMFGAPL